MHHTMTHVSLKRGLKKTKEKVEKAISKELLQLHMKITFQTLMAGNSTAKKKTLLYNHSCS